MDLALLELVLLLGLVYASIERFGRRLRPLLDSQHAGLLAAGPCRPPAGVGTVRLGAGGGVRAGGLGPARAAPARAPGHADRLGPDSGRPDAPWRWPPSASPWCPIGMLCSQYLFFLGKPRAPVIGAVAGAVTSAAVDRGAGARRGSDARVVGAPGREHGLRPRHRAGLLSGPGRRRGVLLCLVLEPEGPGRSRRPEPPARPARRLPTARRGTIPPPSSSSRGTPPTTSEAVTTGRAARNATPSSGTGTAVRRGGAGWWPPSPWWPWCWPSGSWCTPRHRPRAPSTRCCRCAAPAAPPSCRAPHRSPPAAATRVAGSSPTTRT